MDQASPTCCGQSLCCSKAPLENFSDQILRQGGIAPLLWDGAVSELTWNIKTDPVAAGQDSVRNALTYELSLRRLGQTSSYRIEREQLANYYRVEAGQMSEPFKFLERNTYHAVTFDQQEHGLAAHEGSVPDDQTLLSMVAGPFGNPVILAFRDHLVSGESTTISMSTSKPPSARRR